MREPMDDTVLAQIAADTIARYRRRFLDHGYGARALGWGSTDQQRYRYAQTRLGPIDVAQHTVLDIGCGFGDYRDFLLETSPAAPAYHGWDVNADLIAEAARRHAHDSGADFAIRDIIDPVPPAQASGRVADVGVMLGVLNFNLGGRVDNYAYSELAIVRAWTLVGRALIVDFLSSHRTTSYPAEDWVFHHDPARMLEFALTLSPRVVVKHDYSPIPQREFMLFIERE